MELVGEPQARTDVMDRPIRQWDFVPGGNALVFLQDRNGDENFQLFAIDLRDDSERCLTPWPNTRARIIAMDDAHPDEVLVGVNQRDPRFFDVWRINALTGEATNTLWNDEGWHVMMPDATWTIRLATRIQDDGSTDVMLRVDDPPSWQPFVTWAFEESMGSSIVSISSDGTFAYLIDNSRDLSPDIGALYEVSLVPKGERQRWRILATESRGEAAHVLLNAVTRVPELISYVYRLTEWRALDIRYESDLSALRKTEVGIFQITGRTSHDSLWLIEGHRDTVPVRYSLYRRSDSKAVPLFSSDSRLAAAPLVPMESHELPSRDGLALMSYVSMPAGFKAGAHAPLALVVLVHGGPWSHDEWGVDPTHQWLANRGYAVLSVNFRGSTGFGKRFVNAGNREWSRAMHNDLIDAAQYCVNLGIADPDRVAIMGTSYGGYATLVGLTFTPEMFACGVDIVGPSHVRTLLEAIPPYWTAQRAMYKHRVGDVSEVEWLDSISPLTYADRVTKPLLIGHGANDPRVKRSQSDQFVAALQANSTPVTYVIFPDEGHGFALPANRLAFYAITEQFLAAHLGGRAEPLGAEIAASSAHIEAGRELIPGLSAISTSSDASSAVPASGATP